MKVIGVSDLHGTLPAVEPCDLLLVAGDICPVSDHSIATQAQFLGGPFAEWLERVPAKHVVGVAGNHDFIFEHEPRLVPEGLRWHYLQDADATIEGLKVYGTPWQPWFYDWAFNLREPELARKWELIPEDTDVLVCHGPPYGYGDAVPRRQGPPAYQGSPSLLEAVKRVKPRLMVYGHLHEGRGRWDLGHADGSVTTLANVTLVDVSYRPVYPPMAFELPES